MKGKIIAPAILIMYSILMSCMGGEEQKENKTIERDRNMKLSQQKVSDDISVFTISNNRGMSVKITNYGGIVQSMVVPDRHGEPGDVVLGFDSVRRYAEEHPYFGAIVGRYANRIREGKIKIDGKEFQLSVNNGPHHLHGGLEGLDKKIWKARTIEGADSAGVELKYSSPEGDQGYPGKLDISVIYLLNNENELKIDYRAESSAPTPVNLTNHSYFNLTGDPQNDILDHVLMIDADKYTVVDEELIPTGELRDVSGTPFDFREATRIGKNIDKVEGGYDHNFVLDKPGKGTRKVVEVIEPGSGRIMEISTSKPGIQFYTGNFLDGSITGKNGIVYNKHAGFCLETQHFPDSPNQPDFPGVILEPGEVYRHTTIYKFTTLD